MKNASEIHLEFPVPHMSWQTWLKTLLLNELKRKNCICCRILCLLYKLWLLALHICSFFQILSSNIWVNYELVLFKWWEKFRSSVILPTVTAKMLPAFFSHGSLRLGSQISGGFKSIVIFWESGICLFNFPILFCSLEEQLTSITMGWGFFEELKTPCKTMLDFVQYNCVPSIQAWKEGSELFCGFHLVWMKDLWHTLCVYVLMDSHSLIWQLENFSLLIPFFRANYTFFYWTPFFLFIIICCIMKCMGFFELQRSVSAFMLYQLPDWEIRVTTKQFRSRFLYLLRQHYRSRLRRTLYVQAGV